MVALDSRNNEPSTSNSKDTEELAKTKAMLAEVTAQLDALKNRWEVAIVIILPKVCCVCMYVCNAYSVKVVFFYECRFAMVNNSICSSKNCVVIQV